MGGTAGQAFAVQNVSERDYNSLATVSMYSL